MKGVIDKNDLMATHNVLACLSLLNKYSLRSFLSVFLACIFRSYLTVLFVFLGYDLSIIPFFQLLLTFSINLINVIYLES